MAHLRSPLYKQVPIKDLIFEIESQADKSEYIVELYKKLFRGKIKLSLTRIAEDKITSGFLYQESGVINYKTIIDDKSVSAVIKIIRQGERPTIDLVWSPLVEGGGGYICADDENVLAAYRYLGIKIIPCRVLRPQAKASSEAAIWIKEQKDIIYHEKLVPSEIEYYKAYAVPESTTFKDAVAFLISKCASARAQIKLFHAAVEEGIHYHQMLFAVLIRHERTLRSVLELMSRGCDEHASVVLRLTYEAFLNFYIDWLSPQFFGPRLQLLSIIKIEQGFGSNALDKNLGILGNVPGLIENVRAKARISPLGEHFYNSLYPWLSTIAHQSYGYLEREASSFDIEFLPDPRQEKQILLSLNVLTYALVSRINNEIGEIAPE